MNLSIICVFQDQQDLIEPLLKELYTMINPSFEVIIIDDGSRDGTFEQIQQVSKRFDHDATTILRHEEALGKGTSLNKAASIASKDILWLVDRVDHINAAGLSENLNYLIEKGYQGLIMSEEPIHQEVETWVENINNGNLLSNEYYLWNWSAIPQHQRFFNPFQSDLHCIELSIRLAAQTKIVQAPLCFETVTNKNRLSAISSNRAEILMSLFRERKVSVEQSDLLLSQLKLREKKFGIDTTNRNTGDLIYEAKALIAEGYNSDALDICNKLHELYPENVEVITLKIQVLNRLHRYVEAAELKYEINQRYGINLAIPKATPKITLVVPDEITAEDDISLVQKKVFPPPLAQLLISPPDETIAVNQQEDLPDTLFVSNEPPVEPLEPETISTEELLSADIIEDTAWESDSALLDEIANEIELELVYPKTEIADVSDNESLEQNTFVLSLDVDLATEEEVLLVGDDEKADLDEAHVQLPADEEATPIQAEEEFKQALADEEEVNATEAGEITEVFDEVDLAVDVEVDVEVGVEDDVENEAVLEEANVLDNLENNDVDE